MNEQSEFAPDFHKLISLVIVYQLCNPTFPWHSSFEYLLLLTHVRVQSAQGREREREEKKQKNHI